MDKSGQPCENKLDPGKVKMMEFIVFNNPEDGDEPGSGTFLIDRVQGAMAIPVGSPWASAEEQRQKTIALKLASNSQYLRNQTLDLLPLSVLLAAESLSRYPSLEADTVLRQGLSLLAKPISDKNQADWVYCMALSPDGTRLAAAGWNSTKSTMRVFEAKTLKEIMNITHMGLLKAVVFNHDATLLAIANRNNAEIWEIDSGREIASILHDSSVNGIAFSSNGSLLTTTSSDGVLRVWEIDTGKEIANATLKDQLLSVAFGPEGKIRVLCGDRTHFPENFLKVIDIKSGNELLNISKDSINSLLSSDGSRMSIVDWIEDIIEIRDIEAGNKIRDIIPGDDVSVTAISQDGTRLAVGGRYGTIRIWDIDTGKELSRIAQGYRTWAIALNSDGTRLATSSGGGTTIVSNVDTREEISRIAHPNWVYSLKLSPDGARIAKACFDDKTVRTMKVGGGGEEINSGTIDIVDGFVFSPDCTKLAIIGDGIVRIWNAFHAHEVAQIPFQNGAAVKFSCDGSMIATVDRTGTVGLWYTDSGKGLTNITHHDWVTAIDFSPDGTQLATGTRTGIIRIWDINEGKELFNMKHKDAATSINFNPNGTEIAIGSLDGIVMVWDIIKGEEVANLTYGDMVGAIVFNPDGERLTAIYVNETRNTIKIWDILTGKEIVSSTESAWLNGFAFSMDRTRLARIYDFNATVWDTDSGKEISNLIYDNRILDAALSPDGSQLTTASWNSEMAVWDISPGFNEITGEGELWDVSCLPDGVPKVLVSRNETVRVLAIDSGKEISNITLGGNLDDAVFSSDGTKIITIANNRILSTWRTDNGKELDRTECKEEIGSIRAVSPNGNRIVTEKASQILTIWDVNTAREIAYVDLSNESAERDLNDIKTNPWIWRGIPDIAFNPNGDRLALAVYDGTARILDAETGQEIVRVKHDYERPVEAIAFSPDGSLLATGAGDLTARIWNAGTGKEIKRITHEGELKDIEFSPDGKLMATACTTADGDFAAWIWEVKTGRKIAKMTHKEEVDRVLFDPEGKKLITISGDNILRVWDWQEGSGREVTNIVHEGAVAYALFTPDGTKLITTNNHDTVSMWNWLPEDMIAEACTRLSINLKQDEWKLYSGCDEPYKSRCDNLK
jgi:WD40 repeat protein